VDCEDSDEEKRPGKEPRTAAVTRRRRHQLRFRSGAARRGGVGLCLLSPGGHTNGLNLAEATIGSFQ
jgi:hypothetical protein